ncbi:DUF6334 family protein [Actinoplanes sp. NPDC051851]|uniref:DUF6334 family protein n=1 Tax=Actinoplanes sp. NPDC051851 TaxID=3154753 RepID=UPI00343638F4
MTIQETFTAMTEQGGPLRAVTYLYDPELPREIIAIRLGFDGGDWLVSVDPDDDTIAVGVTTADGLSDLHTADASTLTPWAGALGKGCRWAWVVENQQGYLDALQWEFTGAANGSAVTVQVLAISSQLRVRTVLPVETPYLGA